MDSMIFGMKLYGSLDFCMKLGIWYEIMCIWIMVGMSMVFKPRVLIEFHPHLSFFEIRVGKTPYGTR